ncbi:hypothetical protein [uncultured Alistipes sp.]|uniref:hypothetical protein n=1 Tax=uncultured Alistipes sp. TaxID=538949 RepID=UPI0026654ADD|nr:hypothetical protein [uncultured Alistipes sp.]
MNDFFNRTKIQKKQQSQTPGWHSAKKLPARGQGAHTVCRTAGGKGCPGYGGGADAPGHPAGRRLIYS